MNGEEIMKTIGLGFAALFLIAGLSSSFAGDAPKYDMSKYRTLAQDAEKLVKSGDYAGALAKLKDLEKQWDDGTTDLKAANKTVWKAADKEIDVALDACKAAKDAASAAKVTKAIDDF